MIDMKPAPVRPEEMTERLPGESEVDFSLRMWRAQAATVGDRQATDSGPLDKAMRVWGE